MNGDPFVGLQNYAVSGRYVRRLLGPGFGTKTKLNTFVGDIVRLDVDGYFPTMTASGTLSAVPLLFDLGTVDWIAHPLTSAADGIWEGDIRNTWGSDYVLPWPCKVRIEVPSSLLSLVSSKMTVTFFASGFSLTRTLHFESPYFRHAELEVDVVEGATRVTSIDTHAHANRPASLRHEQLSIDKVYDRAGVEITRNPNFDPNVPLACAQEDRKWSDQELNDAMRIFWTRYKNRAQWAFWILYAGLHERHSDDLRGTMFDFTGTYQRQGCAAFTDVWDKLVPPDYPQRAAHIARMRFYSAVHESGHCFHLIHSDEKGEPNERSFMNYPENVSVETFFNDFVYRFSERELRFIRHAPDSFVRMGAEKFDSPNAGYDFERAADSARVWALEVSPAQQGSVLSFLNP